MYSYIATSVIQAVFFTREQGDTYSIRCSFLTGGDASGCVYVLLSGEVGVKNITGSIDRNSSGVSLVVANIGCYSEVLAYANTSDALPVIIRESIITEEVCSITGGEYNIMVSSHDAGILLSQQNNWMEILFSTSS